MSINLPSTDKDNAYIRLYMVEITQARIFGAVFSAAEYRKESAGLTRKTLAELMGKDEGAVSKLFAKPSNMTLKTLAEVCFALEVELEFALVDKKARGRVFLDVGMRCREVHRSQRIMADAGRRSVNNETISSFISTTRDRLRTRRQRHLKWDAEAITPISRAENYVLIVDGNFDEES